ncbi:hypothetical protein VTL71DRAFT_12373 [Oculimacula yallundae]|uniref:DUF6536 domain-containing protein n=1 Tax=Oculimacula yallundae TaxID=86028 RepID=A0ABR4CP74_9HELO
MEGQFSRLFDEWDDITDISMVELGTSPTSPTSQRHQQYERASFNTRDSITSTLPYYDETSTRSLLRKESQATTASDYDVQSPYLQGDISTHQDSEPRQRKGFKSNVQQIWSKRSVRSARTTSTFDGNFAHGKPGWWKKQMLVDRSLRTMAAFMAVCTFVMFIIIFTHLGDFKNRINTHTTSVGGKDGESCKSVEKKNVAIHLFINIAATMVLGCSNTYQQLVTALKVDEIRWVLSKRGDSKVGTNSPWSINHKREGKTWAWLAWTLLILTSIPVHFLANSVIGPSFYIRMPSTITYTEVGSDISALHTTSGVGSKYGSDDTGCWTAFRSGSYMLAEHLSSLSPAYNAEKLGNSTTYRSVEVRYTSNCTEYRGTTDHVSALNDYNHTLYTSQYHAYIPKYSIGKCEMASMVACNLGDELPRQCRENVRMQAAFILGGCLLIKAGYMIAMNFRSRTRTKDHCLTFGDVIVASVLDPDSKVKNECLLNSGDGYRHEVVHTCHKHCKDPISSTTGDDIGHCQKCKKFNEINMSADLPHPSIAIKYKKSLLSNLGSTAISQMLILMFTSAAMVGTSIALIVSMATTADDWHRSCHNPKYRSLHSICEHSVADEVKQKYGTWGGFSSSATLSALPPDSLGSEFMAFAISNGAQFLYSLLYLLLIYNLSLISMEHEWGQWEMKRKRPRCTIVSGRPFEQSYFLQLPWKVMAPLMGFASLMHWLLGQAISTVETIYLDPVHGVEHSIYFVTYAAYPIFMSTILMVGMTVVCWWAFTYTREGFIPQMYGSIRACCASTTELVDFNTDGILWGDLGMGENFRHAGFSSDEPEKIVPADLYCGRD